MECFRAYLKIHLESPLFPFSFLVPEQADGGKQKVMVVQAAGDWFLQPELVQNGGGFQGELQSMLEQELEIQLARRLTIIGSSNFASCGFPHYNRNKMAGNGQQKKRKERWK